MTGRVIMRAAVVEPLEKIMIPKWPIRLCISVGHCEPHLNARDRMLFSHTEANTAANRVPEPWCFCQQINQSGSMLLSYQN